MGAIAEVVQTVKHPRSHILSVSENEEMEKFNLDDYLPKSSENDGAPSQQTPQADRVSGISCMSSSQELDKNQRKSGRVSLMG